MNLRNNQISVRELIAQPKAKAVFERRFGKWMKHPLFAAAQGLSLGQLAEMAGVYLPQTVIQETLNELKEL